MTNRATPRRPTGLSGQEAEDLRSLEKGYDPEGGALPDPDPHDDPTRKPGDDAIPRSHEKDGGDPGRGQAARHVDPSAGEQAGKHGQPKPLADAEPRQPRPLADAERRGLQPSDTVAAPPMDRPDDTAAGPANLDPDPARRRP
jgi:hypothetical protein